MNSEAKHYKRLQNPMQITIEVEETEDNEATKEAILEQIRQIAKVKQAIYFGSGTPDSSFSGARIHPMIDTSVTNWASNFDDSPSLMLESVDENVRQFIASNTSFLISAYKMRDIGTEQHYALALKEDTRENRRFFFSFMHEHNDSNEGEKYPISFHFVEARDIKKAGGLEPIFIQETQTA